MSATPPYLHKNVLENIANARCKIVIYPDKKVEIEPVDLQEDNGPTVSALQSWKGRRNAG